MKKIFGAIVVMAMLLLMVIPAFAGVFTVQFAPTGQFDSARSFDLDMDAAGNSYVGGRVVGAFPGETYQGGNGDIFVAKFDPSGGLVWLDQFGQTGNDNGRAVAVGPSGEVAVAGRLGNKFATIHKYDNAGNPLCSVDYFAGGGHAFTLDFDSSGNIYAGGNALSFPTLEIDVRKFDSNCNQVWFVTFPEDGSLLTRAKGISVDESDNLFVVGTGPTFVKRLDPASGNELWSRTLAGGLTEVFALNGQVATAGYTLANLSGEHNPAGKSDALLAVYDIDGNLELTRQVWSITPNYERNDEGRSVAIDSEGRFVLAGVVDGTIPGLPASPNSLQDAFLVGFTASGERFFTDQQTAGTRGVYVASGMGIQPTGEVNITGFTQDVLAGATNQSPLFQDGFIIAWPVVYPVLTFEEVNIEIADQLIDIINDPASSPALVDKVEDALASINTAIAELQKVPPDLLAALGNIEGAQGVLADIDTALLDGLDPQIAEQMKLDMAEGAQRAVRQEIDAIAEDLLADPVVLAEAEALFDEGDAFLTIPDYKSAVAKYKDALSQAQGAIP